MASHIKRGETLFIPFRDGVSFSDSQLKPRMYKTVQAFERSLPGYYKGTDGVELVEYAEVVHSSWVLNDDGSGTCKHCHRITKSCWDYDNQMHYCPNCGALMDLEVNDA